MNYDRNIAMSFKIISNQIRRIVDERLGYSITNIQMFILGFIKENLNSKDIYQKDIEKLLNVRRSTVTEILNVMERKGLVERIASSFDKRKKIIVLASKGRECVNEFDRIILSVEEGILKDISKAEQNEFFSVLEKIKSNLDNL